MTNWNQCWSTTLVRTLVVKESAKQCCGSGFIESGSSILKWIRIRIQIQGFDDQDLKKIQLKFFFFLFNPKLQKRLPWVHKGRPGYKRSLQHSKKNIQHFKRWVLSTVFYFSGTFLTSWIRIRIQWPHCLRSKPDPNTDPDPQHCSKELKMVTYQLVSGWISVTVIKAEEVLFP